MQPALVGMYASCCVLCTLLTSNVRSRYVSRAIVSCPRTRVHLGLDDVCQCIFSEVNNRQTYTPVVVVPFHIQQTGRVRVRQKAQQAIDVSIRST